MEKKPETQKYKTISMKLYNVKAFFFIFIIIPY